MKDQLWQFLQKTKSTVASFFADSIALIGSIVSFVLLFGVFYFMLVIKVGMDPGFFLFGVGLILLTILRKVTNP